jgi:hypothetical protein
VPYAQRNYLTKQIAKQFVVRIKPVTGARSLRESVDPGTRRSRVTFLSPLPSGDDGIFGTHTAGN